MVVEDFYIITIEQKQIDFVFVVSNRSDTNTLFIENLDFLSNSFGDEEGRDHALNILFLFEK